jgi:cytosine/adenosine deaminase-related metal-dependent hydrolase
VLAHVNYLEDDEIQLLASSRASVAFCPRTHQYFGHAPHRWQAMLAAGVNVCVATDSLASSPDLNLLSELRLLRRQSNLPARTLWEMVTTRAARALNLETEVGAIAPGRYADLAVFPLNGGDPLEAVLDARISPAALYIGGVEVLRG